MHVYTLRHICVSRPITEPAFDVRLEQQLLQLRGDASEASLRLIGINNDDLEVTSVALSVSISLHLLHNICKKSQEVPFTTRFGSCCKIRGLETSRKQVKSDVKG